MSENKPGLIHACILDGQGGEREINWQQLSDWKPEDGLLWVHFDYSCEDSVNWIKSHAGLDTLVVNSLLAEETRPRCDEIADGIVINLRGVNSNPDSIPEDMVSIRVYTDGRQIISTRKRRLLSIQDIIQQLQQGKGPKTSADFLALLTHRLTERMSTIVSSLEDEVDALEEQIVERVVSSERSKLIALRRRVIMLRRYLSPQRDALTRLTTEHVDWLTPDIRLAIRETTDRLSRYLEDLDSCRDRAAVVFEELTSRMSEEMNKRMYVLSVVAALFLPLGFLTGLFGINVGGIPMAENPSGFFDIFLLLIIIVGLQVVLFKWKRWF
jgi:zinc transporter